MLICERYQYWTCATFNRDENDGDGLLFTYFYHQLRCFLQLHNIISKTCNILFIQGYDEWQRNDNLSKKLYLLKKKYLD